MSGKPVDIGHTVRRGIIHFRNTGKTEVEISEHDAGNGACMRSLPIALYYWNKPLATMLRASKVQSHITHNNPVADAGTHTVLSMLACALGGGSKQQMRYLADKLVDREKSFQFDKKEVTNPSGWIVETLQVVFQSFFEHETLEDILVDTVNRGGDADTTGAIAGMLAGAYYGKQAIPESWLNALDDDVRKACEKQALALIY
jgi:ADP-ribosyl-[dinitrogen reductase] hydrolase